MKHVDNLLNIRVFSTSLLLGLIFFLIAANFDSCGIPRGTISGIPSKPSPPGQSASGPGGKDYSHAGVSKNVYGNGVNQYWIYEPANPISPSAPLIVFLHGGGAINPMTYGAWMEHLVRKGNIVIWPRYQTQVVESFHNSTDYAINAVKNAINRLQSSRHVTPQLDKFAITGHSLGGAMSANMAALAKSVGLPQPKALMPIMPGAAKRYQPDPAKQLPLEDFSKISSTVLMLVVVGADDADMEEAIREAGDDTVFKIFNESTQIPLTNKNFITLMSDYDCEPPLIADHFSLFAPNPDYDNGAPYRGKGNIDALDYYSFWKLFDALMDAAFYGHNREYALGNTSEQRFMGLCDDGTPVNESIVTEYAWFKEFR